MGVKLDIGQWTSKKEINDNVVQFETDDSNKYEAMVKANKIDGEFRISCTDLWDIGVENTKGDGICPQCGDNEYIDYIHICDIDEFIKMLQELKQKAIEHFNEVIE